MAKTDSIDVGFAEGIKKMLGLDDEAINDLLGELSVDQLRNLIYAVEHDDNEGAAEIVKSASVEENDEDEREPIQTASGESRTRKPNVDDDEAVDDNTSVYNVGDTVNVSGTEATVKIPSGPGDTVGVLINGKLKMVDSSEITEGILGMTGMPDLNRIRALAGIMSGGPEASGEEMCEPACDPAVDTNCVEENPTSVEVCPENGGVDGNPAETCMAALQQIEAALPSVRLADLKAIRQRITTMVQTMNESISFSSANKKSIAAEIRKSRR